MDIKCTAAICTAILIASTSGYLITLEANNDIQTSLEHYKKESLRKSQLTAKHIQSSLTQIYQNIRTISLLPGIRGVTDKDAYIDKPTLETIQQIYNNLAYSVAVSEVYINSVDFSPQEIDPSTGKPEDPIIVFDEIIVGKTADSHHHSNDTHYNDTPEEIEIYEYEVIRDQLNVFQAKHPTNKNFPTLAIPMLGSKEILTCDNSRYSSKLQNHDARKGVIFSVPYYNFQGKLQGSVSAIILTPSLTEMLQDQHSALFNNSHNYIAHSQESGQAGESSSWIVKGQKDPNLYFSEVLTLDTPEIEGQWSLWVGYPNHIWDNDTEVLERIQSKQWSIVAICFITFLLLAVFRLFRGNYALQQQALEEAKEAGRVKSEFIASMSHELRTPLHAILNYAKLTQEETNEVPQGTPENLNKYMTNIISSGERLLDLINDILDLSKLNAGMMRISKEKHSLCELTDKSVSELGVLAKNRNISIHTDETTDNCCTALFDKPKIQQVIINLLSNALKFSPKSGDIHISIENQEGRLVWHIRDHGTGVPEGELELIFDPFLQSSNTTSKSGGTGLGLPICKKIIEAHGGTIYAKNNDDGGTTFTFEIPKTKQ